MKTYEEKEDYIAETNEAMEMLGKGYEEEQEIIDASDLRKYRIELPNLYDDAGLDSYEFRLLAHYKRVGTCTESTRTTARKCKMAPSQVSEKRRSLNEKKFIEMVQVSLKDNNFSYRITVVDMWRENFEKYSTRSHSEHHPSPRERGVRTAKQRSNHIKKEPIRSGAGTPPTPKASEIPQVVLFREVVHRYPNQANYGDVIESIDLMKKRLGKEITSDDLIQFYKAWTAKGYNPIGLGWLEWAETGQIPPNGKWKSRREDISQTPVRTL